MENDLDDFDDRFYCEGCGEVIERHESGLAIIFLARSSNKPLRGLNVIHMSDHCKQLVKGDPKGSWSEDCTPQYIRLDQFLEYNRTGYFFK